MSSIGGDSNLKQVLGSIQKSWRSLKKGEFKTQSRLLLRWRGEKEERCFAMHFLYLQSKSFLETSFLYFRINSFVAIPKKIVNNIFHRGIKLNLQRLIQNIWLICKIFVLGGSEDTWLTARACCGHVHEKLNKIWLVIGLCPWDFRTCLCPEDMTGTWPGHFQLRNALCLANYQPIQSDHDAYDNHTCRFCCIDKYCFPDFNCIMVVNKHPVLIVDSTVFGMKLPLESFFDKFGFQLDYNQNVICWMEYDTPLHET